MPSRPSYLPTSTYDLYQQARGQDQLDEAVSQLRAPSLLQDAISGIQDTYHKATQIFNPLPIVVSDRPSVQPVTAQPQAQGTQPAAMPTGAPETPKTPETPTFSASDFSHEDGQSAYTPSQPRTDTTSSATGVADTQSFTPGPPRGDPSGGVEQWDAQVQAASKKYGVPPEVIKGIMHIESGGNPQAVSSAGALGLMQVMPFHYGAGENGLDPDTSIDRGTKILADNFRRYGDWDRAAAAYFGAIDDRGNITDASDGNTTGSGYVRMFRDAASRYAAPPPNAGVTSAPALPAPPAAAASPAQPAAGAPAGGQMVIRNRISGQTLSIPASRWGTDFSPETFDVVPDQMKVGADLPDTGLSAGDQKRAKLAAARGETPTENPDMLRQPLAPTMGPDTNGSDNTLPFDPRDQDVGPREAAPHDLSQTPPATYGQGQDDPGQPPGATIVALPSTAPLASDQGQTVEMPVRQRPQYQTVASDQPLQSDQGAMTEMPTRTPMAAQSAPSTYGASDDDAGTLPTPPRVVQASMPNPLLPLYDLGGRIIGYVQHGAEALGNQISQNMQGNRQAVEDANQGASGGVNFGQGVANAVSAADQVLPASAGGLPDISARMRQIEQQAAADQGITDPVRAMRAPSDPAWRAQNPELAAEYDDLQSNYALGVGGLAEPIRPGPTAADANAGPNVVQRARSALNSNAERVAAADARAAESGSVTAPGTLGVISNNPLEASRAASSRIVPPDVADSLDFPVRVPTDPATVRAIEAAGGSVDPERGVTLNVIRYQGPEAHGQAATRASTFYTADKPGAPSPYATADTGGKGVGGSERIEGPTRYRSPMVLSDAPGSERGFNEGMGQLGQQEHPDVIKAQSSLNTAGVLHRQAIDARNAAFERWKSSNPGRTADDWVKTPDAQYFIDAASQATSDLEEASVRLRDLQTQFPSPTAGAIDQGIRQARRAGPPGSPERAQALKDLVSRYGGDPGVIDDLLAVRGADDSESAWAIKENILASNARRQGYDGVLTVQPHTASEEEIMSHPAVKAAQEAYSEAHQRYLDAQRAETRAGVPTESERWRQFSRALSDGGEGPAPLSPEHQRVVEQTQAAAQAGEDAMQALREARVKARQELDGGRITELADFRESHNPTPGPANPLIAEFEQRVAAANDAEFQALQQLSADKKAGKPESPDLVEAYRTARSERLAYSQALERLRQQTDLGPGAPGYTLRPDLARRQRSYDELSRAYQAAQERARTAPAAAEGEAAQREMQSLQQELMDAYRREKGGEATATVTPGISASTRVLGDVSNAIGGGVGGATIGAGLPAENDEERRRNALIGAGAGMLAGPAAGRLMRSSGGALATPGVGPNGQRRLRLTAPETRGRPIELTPAEEVSRLRLDKFPEEVRGDIENAAREQNWARDQRRGVLPDDVVQQMAQDDAASVDQIIKGGKAGKAYNPEETLAIRNAVASQANVVRDLSQQIAEARANGMAPELLIARRATEATKLNGLVQIAEGARAEAGRTLRAYRQQANLIELNPNKAIEQIYRKLGGRDNAAEAVDQYTQMVNDGADPIQLAKFWAKVESGKITAPDLFALYRRFNMLSGPRTVEVNALSGGLNLGYEVAASALGQAARGRLAEAASEIGAPFKAAGRAFESFAQTMQHGITMEQAARGDIPRTLSNRTDNPVAQRALTVLETPDRFNGAVDQFFRTMTEDWAATRLAQQQARADGLTPRAKNWSETVADRLQAIRDDPSKFPEIKAMADRVAFSDEPGAIGQGLEAFRRKAPFVANLLFPFIRTPYNIASRAVDISPLGIVRTGVEAATGLGRGRENLSPRVRDNLIGTAAAVWAYDQAQKGNVTGAGPNDPEKNAELRATGWQPYSVKIGDKYWSYANFAPFSLALSSGAAAAEAQKYTKPGKTDALSMLSDGAARTAQVVTDMTVLAGLGAVVKSIQDPERYGTQWLTQFLQTLIPAGSALNTIGQATDPLIRRSERSDVGMQITQNLEARVPGLRQSVPAAQDPLGRPVLNEQTGLGALNPFRPTTEREDPALQPFIDAGVDIGAPKKELTVRSGIPAIELTPEEQRRWNELRGQQLQQSGPAMARAQGYRDAQKDIKQTLLKRILNSATEAADRQLMTEWGAEGLRQRINDAIQKKRAS